MWKPSEIRWDQCVGDTLCIGGIMYGQRGVNAMLEFCKDIREVAAPVAFCSTIPTPTPWLPGLAIHTAAYPPMACATAFSMGTSRLHRPWARIKKDVDIICAGLNHQTWYISVKTDGVERTGELYEYMKKRNFCQERKRSTRRDEKLRLLFHRIQRPPFRIFDVVQKTSRRNGKMDQL